MLQGVKTCLVAHLLGWPHLAVAVAQVVDAALTHDGDLGKARVVADVPLLQAGHNSVGGGKPKGRST